MWPVCIIGNNNDAHHLCEAKPWAAFNCPGKQADSHCIDKKTETWIFCIYANACPQSCHHWETYLVLIEQLLCTWHCINHVHMFSNSVLITAPGPPGHCVPFNSKTVEAERRHLVGPAS